MTYEFHPEAEAEHLETVAFYETQRAGLGASYLAEFESILELACETLDIQSNMPQTFAESC